MAVAAAITAGAFAVSALAHPGTPVRLWKRPTSITATVRSLPGMSRPYVTTRDRSCRGLGSSKTVRRRLGPLGDTGRVYRHFRCRAVAYPFGRPAERRRYCFDVHILPRAGRFLRFSYSRAWRCP